MLEEINKKIEYKKLQIDHIKLMIEENKRIISLGENWQEVEEEIPNPEDHDNPIKEVSKKDINDIVGRTSIIPRLEELLISCEKELEDLKESI